MDHIKINCRELHFLWMTGRVQYQVVQIRQIQILSTDTTQRSVDISIYEISSENFITNNLYNLWKKSLRRLLRRFLSIISPFYAFFLTLRTVVAKNVEKIPQKASEITIYANCKKQHFHRRERKTPKHFLAWSIRAARVISKTTSRSLMSFYGFGK